MSRLQTAQTAWRNRRHSSGETTSFPWRSVMSLAFLTDSGQWWSFRSRCLSNKREACRFKTEHKMRSAKTKPTFGLPPGTHPENATRCCATFLSVVEFNSDMAGVVVEGKGQQTHQQGGKPLVRVKSRPETRPEKGRVSRRSRCHRRDQREPRCPSRRKSSS